MNERDDFDIDSSAFGQELSLLARPLATDSLTIYSSYQSNIVVNLDPSQYHNPQRDASMLLAFIVNHLPSETWNHFITELFARYIAPQMIESQMKEPAVVKEVYSEDKMKKNIRALNEKIKANRKKAKEESDQAEE